MWAMRLSIARWKGVSSPVNEVVLKKIGFLILATLSLALAFIGAILPLMPTFPFVILAAWAFSKSDERYYQWLKSSKWFGKAIHEWEENRAISRKSKIFVTVTMSVSLILTTWMMGLKYWYLSLIIAIIFVIIWIILWKIREY